MTKGALAIFAKTVDRTPVKTRLAAEIGVEAATQLYRQCVEVLYEIGETVAKHSNGTFTPFWALAEQDGLNDQSWTRTLWQSLWTGGGSLGECMFKIHDELLQTHDYVILIGTDSPQLTPDKILEAADIALENPNGCVLGPANDGGFYLLGSSCAIPKSALVDVVYSQQTSMQSLINNLEAYDINIKQLTTERDIDHVSDFIPVAEAIEALTKPLPSQQELLKWFIEQNYYKGDR